MGSNEELETLFEDIGHCLLLVLVLVKITIYFSGETNKGSLS